MSARNALRNAIAIYRLEYAGSGIDIQTMMEEDLDTDIEASEAGEESKKVAADPRYLLWRAVNSKRGRAMYYTHDTDTEVVGLRACWVCHETPGMFPGTRLGCFRCQGKGEHNLADRRRNSRYDYLNPGTAEAVQKRAGISIFGSRSTPLRIR